MLVSMTGFGSAVGTTVDGELQVEIQSVNSRFLLIKMALPKLFSSLDLICKKALSEKITRGTLFIHVSLSSVCKENSQNQINIELAKALKKDLVTLSQELALPLKDEEVMTFLLRQESLFKTNQTKKGCEKALLKLLKSALKNLIQTKTEEGLMLSKDIEKRLKVIQKCAIEIKKYEKKQPKKVAEKLASTLKLLSQHPEEEKFIKEIALLADKANISEEVIRLNSHIDQMLQMISKSTVSSGKKMEFFASELFREVNTIAQKSLFKEMIQLTIEMKTQIEKIKEQLANIE